MKIILFVSKESQKIVDFNTVEYEGEKFYFGKIIDRDEIEGKYIDIAWRTEEKNWLSLRDGEVELLLRNKVCQWDPIQWRLGTSDWFIQTIVVRRIICVICTVRIVEVTNEKSYL